MELPTIEQMLEAGLHFGHQTKRWNPKMKPYIFGERNGIHIIDLRKSQKLLEESLSSLEQIAAEGKKVLLVGTKRQAKDVIRREAERIGMPYVIERWLGGTITNFSTIRRSMARLEELEKLEQDGPARTMTKKEMQSLLKERAKLEKVLAGVRHMTALPGLVYVIDCKKERIAVSEAVKLGIPVMAIVDTNVDPDSIDHIIPGNDDAMKSIKLVTRLVAKAIERGTAAFEEKQALQAKAEPPAKEAPVAAAGQPSEASSRRPRPADRGGAQRRPRQGEGRQGEGWQGRPGSGGDRARRDPRGQGPGARGPRERRPERAAPLAERSPREAAAERRPERAAPLAERSPKETAEERPPEKKAAPARRPPKQVQPPADASPPPTPEPAKEEEQA
ncbi:30S ribosomal protein S2 [Candidatus Fermentibacteria bacterium]|nr:30S ribosomal protein S2 [Candidatus Fermentibacteria bacterium]